MSEDFDVEHYLQNNHISNRLDEIERTVAEQDKRQTRQAWYGFVILVIQVCLFLFILTL